jgi:hypothetical protein
MKDLPIEIEKQIVQKAEIFVGETTFTLAVIGSSHFLYLPNCFCELLTCAPPKLTTEIFFEQQMEQNFELAYSFGSEKFTNYTFSLFFHHFEKKEFDIFEKDLLTQSARLCQTFEKESAITFIQVVENEKNSIKIETWHTYPEALTAVQTKSSIIFAINS